MDDDSQTYIDYDSFLSPSFSPTSFANTLIHTTNNSSDTQLDLSTPLSRVLFDIQEIDTHIHNLTSKHALPLLTHVTTQTASSRNVTDELSEHVKSLTGSYERLQKDVQDKYRVVEQVRSVTERLWKTVYLGRLVGRCLSLGRTLEVQLAEMGGSSGTSKTGGGREKRDDHRAMLRAANTLVQLRQLLASNRVTGKEDDDENEIGKVRVIKTLKEDLISPGEKQVIGRAQQMIREFSMTFASGGGGGGGGGGNVTSSASGTVTSTATYIQTEETKARTTSAVSTLYLLSAVSSTLKQAPRSSNTKPGPGANGAHHDDHRREGSLLLDALQAYLQAQLTSSLAALSRALVMSSSSTAAQLERTLLEISARCQNVVALETLLGGIHHPIAAMDAHHVQSGVGRTDGQSSTAAARATRRRGGDNKGVHNDDNSENDDDDEDMNEEEDDDDEREEQEGNMLLPLLHLLETTSLASFFWRSLASGLTSRLRQDPSFIGGGGLGSGKVNHEKLKEMIQACVLRGFLHPFSSTSTSSSFSSSMTRTNSGITGRDGKNTKYADERENANMKMKMEKNEKNEKKKSSNMGREREVAVMIGAVLGVLNSR